MAEYIVQKAVSPDKVKKKLQRSLAEYGATFHAYKKYDGCCAVIRAHDLGGYAGFSRTGEPYPSLDNLAFAIQGWIGPGFVVIGEAWWPGKDQFNLISGEFRRMRPSERLQLMVHDILTDDEFAAGHSPVPFRERMQRVDWFSAPFEVYHAEGWPAGSYGCPQELCNKLVEQGGYDGLVLRDPEGTWTKGSGTTGEIVKIKRVLSFDLRVTAIYEGVGKHAGRMGAIGVDFNGQELRVGTGFTDEQRVDWWCSAAHLPTGSVPVDDLIAEIEAMDYSSDGLLREPRFKGLRFDKLTPDT